MPRHTFRIGQRVWARSTGWDGAIFTVESIGPETSVDGESQLTLRSERTGRRYRRWESQMVPVLPSQEEALKQMQAGT